MTENSEKTASVMSGKDTQIATCPVCSGTDVSAFWEARGLPVFCNVLCESRVAAREIPLGDIVLAYCPSCGFIQNRAFDPEQLDYDVKYENSLHHSARFQAYADALAKRLVSQYDLRDKDVLEIACGQGDFLKALCRIGDSRGLGFDPAYVPKASDTPGTDHVTFVQDYYSSRYADRKADFICCRHALEHFADPRAFLRGIRDNIRESQTVVFFEVPNALFTLRELGIWDLIYEHCNYFVKPALRRCFEEAGFEVLDCREEFGGQFLSIEAMPAKQTKARGQRGQAAQEAAGVLSDAPNLSDAPSILSDVTRDVRAFAQRYENKVAVWQERLAEMRAKNRRAVVWGSGSKGVTFLNILDPGDRIEYVVDINPRKQGQFVAGTGQDIVSPEALCAYQPDVVIVMNPLYVSEIRQTLADLRLAVEVVVA